MAEPRIAMFHPDFADEEDFDVNAGAAYVAMLGPFLQTYPGLTVDDYWQLSLTEHAAMVEWLYSSGVAVRPKPKPVISASARDALSMLQRYRDEQDGEEQGGVREPIRPTPHTPTGAVAVEVPA